MRSPVICLVVTLSFLAWSSLNSRLLFGYFKTDDSVVGCFNKMDPETFNSLVKRVLENRTFQSGLENLVTSRTLNNVGERQGQENSLSFTPIEAAPPSNTTIQDEFRRLFRPSNNFSRPSTSTTRSATSKYKNAFANFSKQVIVLDSASRDRILNQKEMAILHNRKQIKIITFCKSWSESMVKNHIRTCFSCLEDPSLLFDFVYPCGRQLVQVPLPADESLSGLNLHRVYQNKKIYVRPSVDLEKNVEDNPTDDFFSSFSEIEKNYAQVHASTSSSSDVNNSFVLNHQNILSSHSCISDSDDDNMQQAIENSLIQESHTPVQRSFYDDLRIIQNKINQDELTLINVVREDVLSCVERAFSRKAFSAYKKIDALFVEEEAIDSGGPSREMWRLVLEELRKSCIFEGPEYSKHLKFYMKDYQNNKYYMAGQIIAMSLVHGGPGPKYFSKTFVTTLIYGFKSEKIILSLEDIGCKEIYDELQKVKESKTLEELAENVQNSHYLESIGTNVFIKHLHEREKILDGALVHYLLHEKREAMEQFEEGLKTCDILNLLIKYPEEAYELLCESHVNYLTVEKMNKLFKIEFSEEGTHKRNLEKLIIALWRDYLQLSEDQETQTTLEQILAFVTGAREIPPLGFDSKPSISFLHDEKDAMYPKSNTCAMILYLPVSVTNFMKFKENMEFGIINGGCYFGYS